jgi:hypothetical protein
MAYFKNNWERNIQLTESEIIVQKELVEKLKIAINVISKNWLISKWNRVYREFLTRVLNVTDHDQTCVGKLFPTGGYKFKQIKLT